MVAGSGGGGADGGRVGHSQPQLAGNFGQVASAIRRWPSAFGWM